MNSRVGVTGLLFVLSLSACPKPSEEKDAGTPTTVIVETRAFSAGPHGTGQFIDDAPRNYTSLKLFVGGDESKTITGTYANGRITFENVPGADNVIELRIPHRTLTDVTSVLRYETHRRDVYLEHQQWARTDVTLADAGTNLSLNLTGLTPWGDDLIYLLSSGAQFARYAYPDSTNPPAQDDTSVSGLLLNTLDMYADDFRTTPAVVDSTKGDSLVLLQQRGAFTDELNGTKLEGWNPWASYESKTIASATVTTAQFGAGDPVQLTAAFAPLTSSTLDLDFRSDTFAAARAELDMPADALMAAGNSVYFEIGSGDSLYIAPSPGIWSRGSRNSQRIPEEPACFPDFDGNCDAGCVACNNALTDDYLNPPNVTLPIALSHPFTEPGTEILYNGWRISSSVTVPDAGTATLSASNTITRPLPSSGPIVVQRVLGAPRTLKFDGEGLPPSSTMVETLLTKTPTLTWTAPSIGTPKRYEVEIIDYRMGDTGSFSTYPVSYFVTVGTTARVPEGVLLRRHIYMARVTAVDDPNQPDDQRHISRTGTYLRAEAVTGLFTVP